MSTMAIQHRREGPNDSVGGHWPAIATPVLAHEQRTMVAGVEVCTGPTL